MLIQNNTAANIKISRADKLYDYSSYFESSFEFAHTEHGDCSDKTGVRYEETEEFNFKYELAPYLIIHPMKDSIDQLDFDPSEIRISITLEDISLTKRILVKNFNISEIDTDKRLNICLSDYSDMAFTHGFKVKCLVHKNKTLISQNDIIDIWSKSQILYFSEFIVSTSIDHAFFEIHWKELDSSELYVVEWLSTDVCTVPYTDSFRIIFNTNIRDQFKKLENNRKVRTFFMTYLVHDILKDLIIRTLDLKDKDEMAIENSLYERISSFLESPEIDFSIMQNKFITGDGIEKNQIVNKLQSILQNKLKISDLFLKSEF